MIVQSYSIEDRWFTMPCPVAFQIQAPSKEVDRVSTQRTIVQIVRPPRHLEHETSINLREAWDSDVYFPSIWHARPGIYKDPHVIVACPHYVFALVAKHRKPHAALCRYMALIEQEDDTLKCCPILTKAGPHYTETGRILGVFERCD